MLHVACCTLHVACCRLYAACCMLHVARCMLHNACYTLHVAGGTGSKSSLGHPTRADGNSGLLALIDGVPSESSSQPAPGRRIPTPIGLPGKPTRWTHTYEQRWIDGFSATSSESLTVNKYTSACRLCTHFARICFFAGQWGSAGSTAPRPPGHVPVPNQTQHAPSEETHERRRTARKPQVRWPPSSIKTPCAPP